MSTQMYFDVISRFILLMLCIPRTQQQQQQQQFFPIHNWNCGLTEKICAVDPPTEEFQASSLTECSMKCWLNVSQCLQFNYNTTLPVTSPNCGHYHFRPANYYFANDCQHYVSWNLPRNCSDHKSNGHTDNDVYTVFIDVPYSIRNIYCFMTAAPWTAARDCADLMGAGQMNSGVYTVQVNGTDIEVYCDMTTEGGGWTVFQRREDGSVDFYRDWDNYTDGFGDKAGEFWLGNYYIHLLTSASPGRSYTLRIDLADFDNATRFAEYLDFTIASASDNFRLNIGAYAGDAGDSLAWQDDMKFTTFDEDNDNKGNVNCATRFKGAWWYNSCHVSSNLNGQYLAGNHDSVADGVNWKAWRGVSYSLRFAELKIRPVA